MAKALNDAFTGISAWGAAPLPPAAGARAPEPAGAPSDERPDGAAPEPQPMPSNAPTTSTTHIPRIVRPRSAQRRRAPATFISAAIVPHGAAPRRRFDPSLHLPPAALVRGTNFAVGSTADQFGPPDRTRSAILLQHGRERR